MSAIKIVDKTQATEVSFSELPAKELFRFSGALYAKLAKPVEVSGVGRATAITIPGMEVVVILDTTKVTPVKEASLDVKE